MKKIINGKVYDTETAKSLAWWENMADSSNFGYCSEELYRKKNGEYFLFGEGGPRSKYVERVGPNSWGWGERIMPMSYQEATAWAEEHLDGDKYEEIFGEVREDDSKVMTTMRLTATTVELLRRRADAEGRGIADLADELLAAALKN